MTQKTVTVSLTEEKRASFASELVRLAGTFESTIWIEQEPKRINAKSIMGVLSLGVKNGIVFTIIASGSDEEKALQAISNLAERGSAGAK